MCVTVSIHRANVSFRSHDAKTQSAPMVGSGRLLTLESNHTVMYVLILIGLNLAGGYFNTRTVKCVFSFAREPLCLGWVACRCELLYPSC